MGTTDRYQTTTTTTTTTKTTTTKTQGRTPAHQQRKEGGTHVDSSVFSVKTQLVLLPFGRGSRTPPTCALAKVVVQTSG
jgi:hypothetical protein